MYSSLLRKSNRYASGFKCYYSVFCTLVFTQHHVNSVNKKSERNILFILQSSRRLITNNSITSKVIQEINFPLIIFKSIDILIVNFYR